MTPTPSFIAILDFSTAATDRPVAIAQLERKQPAVGSMPGCLALRIFPNHDSDTGITVLHEWADQASFDQYLASDAFARSGEILRPLMAGTPSSRRFRVELVETVTQIAMDVGYSSLSAFQAAFRDLIGQTPSEYRTTFAASHRP